MRRFRPFRELVQPVAEDLARQAEVGNEDVLASSGVESLRRSVEDELLEHVAPYYFTLFSAFRDTYAFATFDELSGLYQRFLASGLAPPLNEVLANGTSFGALVGGYTRSRVGGIRTMLSNYRQLRSECSELGQIAGISAPLSERHGDGGAVCRISTGGEKIAYKPRSICREARWAALLADLACTRLAAVPAGLRIVGQNDRAGWIGWIEAEELNCRETAADFYYRAGVLLFWIWLLQGRDMVGDNIIAAGSTPVLVDCETLFYPIAARSTLQDQARAFDVVDTGMLPSVQPLLDGNLCVYGALSVQEPRPFRYWALTWAVNGEMSYSRHRNQTLSLSTPRIEGRPVLPQDEVESLVEGFRAAAECVCHHRGEVEDVLRTHVKPAESTRIVLRPTVIYSALLQRILRHPFSGADAAELAKSLTEVGTTLDLAPEAQRRLIEAEVDCLLRLTIPAFYAVEGKIESLEVTVPGIAEVPAQILARLRSLSPDVARVQAKKAQVRIQAISSRLKEQE